MATNQFNVGDQVFISDPNSSETYGKVVQVNKNGSCKVESADSDGTTTQTIYNKFLTHDH